MTSRVWMGVVVGMVWGWAGCHGCNAPGTPTALLDQVPADATVVALVDVGRAADELRSLSPFDAYPRRWSALGADLDTYLRAHLGVSLLDAEAAAFWEGDSGAWGAAVEGDFDGELTGDTATVGGQRAVVLAPDAYLVLRGRRLLVGNDAGLAHELEVASGASPNLADSDDHTAEILRDLLHDQAGAIFSLAFSGAGLVDELGGLGLDIRAVGVACMPKRCIVRGRLPDAQSASRAVDQLESLLHASIAALAAQVDTARQGPPEAAIPAIIGLHAANLFADEMIDIAADGDTAVVSLDTGRLQSGSGVMAAMAAVAIPTFIRYMHRSQTAEATMTLHVLFDSAADYYEADHVGPDGAVLPRQFPAPAPRTPAAVPCGRAERPDPASWEHPTWEALGFAPSDPVHYSYQFDSSGAGESATFTVSAFGDLDCNGVLSTFQYTGFVRDGGVEGGDSLYTYDEME